MSFLNWVDRIGRPVFIRIMLPIALVWLCWEITRHRERTHQIARGEAPSPFGQSPASQSDVPGGGLVNNEALR